MQSIIIIGNKNFSLNEFREIKLKDIVKNYNIGKKRYIIEFNSGYIAFNFEPNLEKEYEKKELEKIPFERKVFISLEYSSIDIVKKVITQGNIDKNVWIDTDNDLIIPVIEFKKCIANDPEWDWRI